MESHTIWECITAAWPCIVNFLRAAFFIDYPCRVYNLSRLDAEPLPSERFLVARLFKSLEVSEAHDTEDGYALKISVFAADPRPPNKPTKLPWCRIRLVGFAVKLLQLATAAIPYTLGSGPIVFLTILSETLLRQWRRNLSQWTMEAVPVHEPSESIYALTRGRNSRNIIVIVGNGHCPKPRDVRSWETLRRPSSMWKTCSSAGYHQGLVTILVTYASLSVLWVFSLAAICKSRDAVSLLSLVVVGGIHMSYNAWLAMLEFTPAMLNISLRKIEEIVSDDAMDVLMDFEATYEKARPLLREFFPDGPRSEAERRWWEDDGNVEYDTERYKTTRRGRPCRLYPHSYPRVVYHPKHGKRM
ncbi:hypothetical protein PG993_003651 [Apiospora rasikravindrae]|uniref:Uncharacterized protein n=1 Tax=Apiospora rasikravindrae TaxID=990691 RepID=A0ABR1U2C7_9PEZI